MSEKKDAEDCPSEEASSQAESYDANKSGTSETYDMKDFCPGIRIEAKDFDGKWYPAKVSDVDWTENEILVHFENWNTKFDEWIPMDSSRLRSLQKPPVQHRKEHAKYSKGEEVMAMWSPYQKYPATIQAVLPNDRYDVLFYDGFLKRLKSHKISKLEGETVKTEVRNFTDIGTKEERRERKRKINVAELFHINKRTKKKGLVHSKSQDLKTYPVAKPKNRNTTLKKSVLTAGNSENTLSEIKQKDDKLPSGTSASTKALVDTIPAAFEVKYINGQTELWSKQLYQRSEGRTAGKLDIVILNPQGRKFRSRNEIMKYCEENGIIYSHEAFDFSAKGRPKSRSNGPITSTKAELSLEDKLLKKGQRKSELLTASQNVLPVSSSEVFPIGVEPPTNDQNKLFIGEYEVVIENGKFICPVKICGKHFRRENLLHMHMKHYHPEFSKYLDYTPSVTDLAYARTVGGLDATELSSPAPRKERPEKPFSKIENARKASETFEYSKEPKKLKLETKPESKVYFAKGTNDVPLLSSDMGDYPLDSNYKSHSLAKNSSSINDELSGSEGNLNALDNIKAESAVPESKGSMSSHSVMKSLKHKLNNRKKSGRFKRSFADHLRKKRLISQDHSKSQTKNNRQQQHSHLRQQLQQAPSFQPTQSSSSATPSQRFVTDDVNSNATRQNHMPRYSKSHVTMTNEMSGKNHLLTTSLSPAIDDETKMNQAEEKGYNWEVKELDEHGKKIRESNRRSFLTGLINARKRRSAMACRIRKKRKKAMTRRMGSSEFPSLFNSGLNQIEVNEPNTISSATTIVNHKNESGLKNFEDATNEKETFQQGIRIKPKRVDADVSKRIQSDPPIRKNDMRQRGEFICVNGEVANSKQGPIKEERENEKLNFSNDLERAQNEEFTVDMENRISQKAHVKTEINLNDLPKSYVLLENVCRKEIYNKYFNVTSRGNDENIRRRHRNKAKSNRRGKRGERRTQGKRVRFEKTVMEKWIPMKEVQDLEEGGEGRRDERKKKPAKLLSLDSHMREEDAIVQVHGLDHIASHETSQTQINSGLELVEGMDDSKSVFGVENNKLEKLRRNEIINCLCGITEEDGLMIQCDICLCWQHGHCAGIFRESDVPDKYICAICKNPYRARPSMKYLHDQEWLKEGTLPTLSFRSKREDIINQRKTILKRSHDLSGSIALLARVIHSLRLKVNIAEKKDHPKLWLWAKKWTEKKPNRLKEDSEVKEEKPEPSSENNDEIKKEGDSQKDEKYLPKAPEPEAPIDSAECKLNLLDHLIHYQTLVDARLSCIESLVAELESMQDDAVNDETPDRYPRTKATVQMLLRDLNTMRKIAII